MPKRTYQPKKRRRARVHGFRSRSRTSDGRAVLRRRRFQRPAPVVRVVDLLLRATAVGRRSLMQRHHRLTGSARISEIHRNGRSVANSLLVMRVSANGLDRSRFCFVASKRVGNAVVRNRIKRRLREADSPGGM